MAEVEPVTLWSISDEMLIRMFGYLDYKDLSRISSAGPHKIRKVAQDESLWSVQCLLYWNITQKSDQSLSWQEVFISFYKDFGAYIGCYKRIRRAWDRIFTFTAQFVPEIRNTLLDGTSEEALDAIEKELDIQFPLDMRCSYRICNGQDPLTNDYSLGLLGKATEQGAAIFLRCLGSTQDPVYQLDKLAFGREVVECDGCSVVVEMYAMCGIEDMGFRFLHYVVLSPRWHRNAIVNFYRSPGIAEKVASSFGDFICDLADKIPQYQIENGRLLGCLPDPKIQSGMFSVEVIREVFPWLYDHGFFFFRFRMKVTMGSEFPMSESCTVESCEMTTHDSKVGTTGPDKFPEHITFEPGQSHTFDLQAGLEGFGGIIEHKLRFSNNLNPEVVGVIDCGSVEFRPSGEVFWVLPKFKAEATDLGNFKNLWEQE